MRFHGSFNNKHRAAAMMTVWFESQGWNDPTWVPTETNRRFLRAREINVGWKIKKKKIKPNTKQTEEAQRFIIRFTRRFVAYAEPAEWKRVDTINALSRGKKREKIRAVSVFFFSRPDREKRGTATADENTRAYGKKKKVWTSIFFSSLHAR